MRLKVWLMLLGCCWFSTAQAASLEQQRDWFVQAKAALDARQMATYSGLKTKLSDYPLTPYLDIWQTRKELESFDAARVEAVLNRYSGIPESYDLRLAWVKQLAEQGEWTLVAGQMAAHGFLRKKLPEAALMADWYAGDKNKALKHYSKAWMRSATLGKLSEPLHRAWLKKGHPKLDERWVRTLKVARKGDWKQVKSLSVTMSRSQQRWLQYWRAVQRNTAMELARWPADLSPPSAANQALARSMIADGIIRLARKDPEQAYQTMSRLRKQGHFSKQDVWFDGEIRAIALRAARRHMPIAAGWLETLPKALQTEETRGWLARSYMLAKNWAGVVATIERMPATEQKQSRWQYWRGYALQALGQKKQAQIYFSGLAQARGYYSFLSAGQVKQPFYFGAQPLAEDPVRVAEIGQRQGVIRAREWLALDQHGKAAREWYAALSGMNKQQWQAAALLAEEWQWPDQGIRAAYRAGKMNALSLRFPMHFEADVMQASADTGLQPAEIWGVIRQESLFNRQAKSPVGASGLMQLMPKTARMVAKQVKMKGGHRQLFSPSVNIRLGARYLADMKNRFQGELALAAAAYNAGPSRVKQWLERTSFDDAAVWVETIPFNETRRYVQHVLAYRTVYEWRLASADQPEMQQPVLVLSQDIGH